MPASTPKTSVPLLIVVLVSFTPNAITQAWPPKLVPNQFTLENYQSLFERLPIGREMLNTLSSSPVP